MAGELARDGDRDDRAPLAAAARVPASVVEPAGAALGAGADRGRLPFAASLELRLARERPPLVPGCLDQQPPRVPVAGLGDRAWPALLTGRVLARGQAEERAEALRP